MLCSILSVRIYDFNGSVHDTFYHKPLMNANIIAIIIWINQVQNEQYELKCKRQFV